MTGEAALREAGGQNERHADATVDGNQPVSCDHRAQTIGGFVKKT